MREILMDFSGLYAEENFYPDGADILSFRGLEETNCYCSEEAAKMVRDAIDSIPAEGIHWIDTGDYHYLSLFWLEKIRNPFTLFLFDNHPDDQDTIFGGDMLSCGNWVKFAKKLDNMLGFCRWDGTKSCVLKEQTPSAYISIDLDVLSRDYARTDWDQGEMTILELKDAILSIADHYRIIAVDICGGLTAAKGSCGQDVNINSHTFSDLRELLLNLMIV